MERRLVRDIEPKIGMGWEGWGGGSVGRGEALFGAGVAMDYEELGVRIDTRTGIG